MRKASHSATKKNLRLYQISTLIALFCSAAKFHGSLLTNFFHAKIPINCRPRSFGWPPPYSCVFFRIRSPALYPAELQAHGFKRPFMP
jgi:hypothetical protein